MLLTKQARKQLSQLDPTARKRIWLALKLLEQTPKPPKAIQLVGQDGLRVRVGDYRIVYLVKDQSLIVLVLKVGHRSSVYN